MLPLTSTPNAGAFQMTMMSYYKLVEMNNNGINIRITNDTYDDNGTGGRKWRASLSKSADGIDLNIFHQAEDLDECVDNVHAKWLKATGQGMPEHKLNILEHHKSAVEEASRSRSRTIDEIPF